MSILENDFLGSKSIDSVKSSDAKEWVVRMYKKGYSYRTINNFKRSLKASLYLAIEDDMIRKNPFNFALDTVLNNDTEPKKGLTAEQADSLVSFARQDTVYRKYVDEIVILPGTGLLISQ